MHEKIIFACSFCSLLKFIFSKKATKIDETFTVDLTSCSKCQIDGEDFINFCGLLRKHELYRLKPSSFQAKKVKKKKVIPQTPFAVQFLRLQVDKDFVLILKSQNFTRPDLSELNDLKRITENYFDATIYFTPYMD